VAIGIETREIRIPVSQGVAGWVARRNEFVNIEDAYEDFRFDKSVDRQTGYRTKSILCGPVNNLSGETIGVIQVINKEGGKISSFTRKLWPIMRRWPSFSM